MKKHNTFSAPMLIIRGNELHVAHVRIPARRA